MNQILPQQKLDVKSADMKSLFMKWLPLIIFISTTLIFFRPQLFNEKYFWDDFVEQVYPNRAYSAQFISKGELPYWNAYSACGMPFLADIQSAVFYPPHFILDYIAGSKTPYPIYLLQLLIISHFLLAQITMYLLCRWLGISSTSSIVSAIAYAFSAPMVLHIFHPMQVEHLAWFPLVVRFFHETYTKKSVKATGWAALILGIMMLSGSAQMTLYCVLFLGLMIATLALWDSIAEKRYSQSIYGASLALSALIISIGIFCIQYIPSKELADVSVRSEMTYEKATEGSLQFKQILTSVVAKAFGSISPENQNKSPFYLYEKEYYLYWDTAFFFGATTFFLGLFALLRLIKQREIIFFSFIIIFAFLFALGSNGFLYDVFYQLPFFGSLRIPARMMVLFVFSFCVMAGYGIDALTVSSKSEEKIPKENYNNKQLILILSAALLPLLFAVGVSTGSMISAPDQYLKVIKGFGSSSVIILFITIGIALATYKKWIPSMIAASIFALLIFIELNIAHADFNVGRSNPVKEYSAQFPENLQELLRPKSANDMFRVSMRAPGIMALKRNQGMTDQVLLFEAYNQLLLARRHPAVSSAKLANDMLAIRYEVGIDSTSKSPGFIRRNDAYPMAWVVDRIRVTSTDSIKTVMASDTTTDYRQMAYTEEIVPELATQSHLDSTFITPTITCTKYEANKIEYTVNMAKAGFFIASEIWYPGWKATVDEQPTKIYKTNYCLRGIPLNTGNHTIVMYYDSSAFSQGRIIGLTSLFFALSIIIIGYVRKK